MARRGEVEQDGAEGWVRVEKHTAASMHRCGASHDGTCVRRITVPFHMISNFPLLWGI